MELFLSFFKAFVVGGLFCLIGQILLNRTSLPPAKILVGFVVLGVVLGAFGFYDRLIKFAGAGATVPITGFGFLLQKGVFDEINKSGSIGILTGALKAGAAGLSVAIFVGFMVAIFFNPKKK